MPGVKQFLKTTNLQTVLNEIANAAVETSEKDGVTAVREYLRGVALGAGISNLSGILEIGNLGGSQIRITISTMLGEWHGCSSVRSLHVASSTDWQAASGFLLDAIHAAMKTLLGVSPINMSKVDLLLSCVTSSLSSSSSSPSPPLHIQVLHAFCRAASIACCRAGASHQRVDVATHIAHSVGLGGGGGADRSSSSSNSSALQIKTSFSLVSGMTSEVANTATTTTTSTTSSESWWLQRGLLLSDASGGSPIAALASGIKASAAVRTKLTGNTLVHAIEGTVHTSNQGAAPANRWSCLDEVLKAGDEAVAVTASSSMQLTLDMDMGGNKLTFLSTATLKAEAEAIAAAEAAALAAAGGKAKPAAKPAAAKPPAKGAAPPDPKTFWCTDPTAIVLPEGTKEDVESAPKYILAKPTADVIAAAAAAAGGTAPPDATRMALSAPRYAAFMNDALVAHSHTSLLIDPADVSDADTWNSMKQSTNGGKPKQHLRLGSRRIYEAFASTLASRSNSTSDDHGMEAAFEAAEKAAVEVGSTLAPHIDTVLVSFEGVTTVSSVLRCIAAAKAAIPSATITIQHSSVLADIESFEVDLAVGVGASDLLLSAPETFSSATLASRLEEMRKTG